MNNVVLFALMRDCGIQLPVSEFKFSSRRWRFDYAWSDAKVAVEVEGGIYGRGKVCPVCGQRKRLGHTSVSGITRDLEKYNAAVMGGWKVLRFTPDQLLTDSAMKVIKKAVQG